MNDKYCLEYYTESGTAVIPLAPRTKRGLSESIILCT